jgi:hypothetical protein
MRSFPDESTLITHLPAAGLEQALSFAEGRMKKKVLGASEALGLGFPKSSSPTAASSIPCRMPWPGKVPPSLKGGEEFYVIITRSCC